jgi:hypothetical protein
MTAERLTLAWVGWYTRGLADPVRQERRDEIASDLWEHRADADGRRITGLAILSRTLRGAPADLSWRRRHRRGLRLPGRRALATSLGWAFALVSYVFLVANFGYAATPLVGLHLQGEDWAPGDELRYALVSAALLALLVVGAVTFRRHPRLGAMLVLTALVVTPIVFWWAAPIYAPLAIAVGWATVTLARRRRRRLAAAS